MSSNNRKRKSENLVAMDGMAKALNEDFSQAASHLSHLHNLTLTLQQRAYRAGEINGLWQLYTWIQRGQGRMPMTIQNVLSYIQTELNSDPEMLAYLSQGPLPPPEPADIPTRYGDEMIISSPRAAVARSLPSVAPPPPHRSFNTEEYCPDAAGYDPDNSSPWA